MKTTHTPGPWELRHERNGPRTDHVIRMGTAAAYFSRGIGQTDIEALANARLIASAPDLLAALEQADELHTFLIAYANEALGARFTDRIRKVNARIESAVSRAKSQA